MEHNIGIRADNIGELQIWIDGQFALVRQAQTTSAEDLRNTRKTVHDLANDVSTLLALNIPDKLANLSTEQTKQESQIEKLIEANITNKSNLTAMKTNYLIIGTVLGALISFIAGVAKVIH